MKANEMESGPRDEGRQALEEFQRAHHQMGVAIAVWRFELQHDLTGRGAAQAFVAQGRARDVTTELVAFLPLLGAAPCVGRVTKSHFSQVK